MNADDLMKRIDTLLSHVWMVRKSGMHPWVPECAQRADKSIFGMCLE